MAGRLSERRFAGWILSAIVIAFGAAAMSAAEAPKLEAMPPSLEHPASGGPAETLLILRNPTTQPLSDISISTYPGCYARSKIRPTTMPQQIRPESEYAWSIQLPPDLPRPIPDALRVRLDYSVGEGAKQARRVLTTQVEVKAAKVQSAEDVAKVELLAGPEGIRGGQRTTLAVSVQNKSDDPLKAISIDLPATSYIRLVKPVASVIIPARQTILIPVELIVDETIIPGKYTLGLTVPLEWGPESYRTQGSVAVTRQVALTVVGESEILTALGVPSLLILPGYLVVVCFLTIRAKGQENAQSVKLWKEITRPDVLVWAITISILATLVYPLLKHRNFMLFYGWQDIVFLWLGSIVVGTAGGGLAQLRAWWRRRREAQAAQTALEQKVARTYVPEDQPAEVLSKMELNIHGAGIVLAYMDGANGRVYQLPLKDAAEGKCWVISQIEVAAPNRSKPAAALLEQILEKADTAAAAKVARVLEQAENAGELTAAWKGGRPAEMALSDFKAQGAEAVVAWK